MLKRLLCGGIAAVALVLSPIARADEAEVKKALEPVVPQIFGPQAKVDGVRKAGVLNLYEVQVGGEVIYSDEKGAYLFLGNIVDLKNRRNLTEDRKNKLGQIKFSDLPLDLAVKIVKGNGKRVVATFEDPNCGWCKKLAHELQGLDNLTIYTFLVPVLGGADSAQKNRAIWCAADRSKAWTDYMLNGNLPPEGKCDAAALDKVMALARKLNIRGTPTIFLADGNRLPGFAPAAQLDMAISKAAGDGK